MKIHKIIVASVLAFALTLSSISTSDLFATTNKDFSDDSTQIPVNNDFVTVPITELTSSSSVEISKNQKNTTATNGTKHNSTVKTKTSQTFTVDGWTFSVYNNSTPHNVEIIETKNKVGNVVIPPTVKFNGVTYKVTRLGYGLFVASTELLSVTIPKNVTYIDDYAFDTCASLTNITIPDGVTYIGDFAFANCSSLSEIVIPESVTCIDDSAFLSCESLTEVHLPDGLTTLGPEVFVGTSILYLDIPKTVTNLDPSFFCSIYNTKITPVFNNPNRLPDADTTSEVYVVSTESTSPLDGQVLPLKNIHLDAKKGLTVYIKYEITPDIDLDGGQMDGDKTFPAWATSENLSEYLSEPTKIGYVFDGWEVVEAKTVYKNSFEYIVGPVASSPQVKLKAVWKSTVFSKNRYKKILLFVLIVFCLLKFCLHKLNIKK